MLGSDAFERLLWFFAKTSGFIGQFARVDVLGI